MPEQASDPSEQLMDSFGPGYDARKPTLGPVAFDPPKNETQEREARR